MPGARSIAARCQTDSSRFYKRARRRQQTGWHPAKFIKSTQPNITRFSLTSSFHSIRSYKHYLLKLYHRLFNFCFSSQKIIFNRKVFNRTKQNWSTKIFSKKHIFLCFKAIEVLKKVKLQEFICKSACGLNACAKLSSYGYPHTWWAPAVAG